MNLTPELHADRQNAQKLVEHFNDWDAFCVVRGDDGDGSVSGFDNRLADKLKRFWLELLRIEG